MSHAINQRNLVTRFWFEFKSNDLPVGLTRGCGVTAFNFEDAISIVKKKIFKERQIPEFKFHENVNIRTLDQAHVIPNMNDPTIRGIWYPMGY